MRRIPDYVRAINPYERLLVKAGIPSDYWRANFLHLRFKTCSMGKQKISPTQQRNGLKEVWTNPNTQYVVLASAVEEEALRAACFVLMQLHKTSTRFKIVPADQLWRLEKLDKEETKRLRTIAVHNVLTPHLTGARYLALRDMLYHNLYRTRLLVVTGTKDPYGFSVKQLGIRPDLCCYFEDNL